MKIQLINVLIILKQNPKCKHGFHLNQFTSTLVLPQCRLCRVKVMHIQTALSLHKVEFHKLWKLQLNNFLIIQKQNPKE